MSKQGDRERAFTSGRGGEVRHARRMRETLETLAGPDTPRFSDEERAALEAGAKWINRATEGLSLFDAIKMRGLAATLRKMLEEE